ncbi:hypothetical protein MM213_05705 [Belliella sp. R4-6]|uniref:DUF4221 domain-containing protein n=1 Tax=Belliella alkalica TaxID=1730871 RepID=A0ABS9V962_9BACT|nr:hypothetical protein [Belliella alkalica]MCH7412966.1 hypothetical protein [Belliella alkalica]
MKRQIFLLMSLFLVFSCSEKSNENNGKAEDLTLVKSDSLQISYLGLLNLMDVHPKSGRILLFDQKKRSLIVSDFDGNNPTEIKNETDSPDSYGAFPLGAGKFSEDGKSFTIISNQGVYTYDLEGNLINGGKHQEAEMPAFSGRASADNEFYWIGDKILTNGAGRTEYFRDTPEFYENYTSFAWFDTLDRKVEKFMNFDEQSIFRNGKAHEIPHFIPRMTSAQDRIYFIQGIEPALNIHELKEPYNKIKRVDLAIGDYYFNKGQNFKDVDPRAISMDVYSGMFENIKILDEYILISFFPGVPELDQSKYENVAYMEVIPKTRKDYPIRMLILDMEGKKLADYAIPNEFDARQWLVRDGYIWFLGTENLEEEEDFVKVFKVMLGKNS